LERIRPIQNTAELHPPSSTEGDRLYFYSSGDAPERRVCPGLGTGSPTPLPLPFCTPIQCCLLGSGAEIPSKGGSCTITVYTTPRCARCAQLKKWLSARGIRFKELDLSNTKIAAELIMHNVFLLSSPIMRVDDKFLGTDVIFKGGRLNEKVLSDLLKGSRG
jgi:glutaredoxin